jgi:hypothetical protein
LGLNGEAIGLAYTQPIANLREFLDGHVELAHRSEGPRDASNIAPQAVCQFVARARGDHDQDLAATSRRDATPMDRPGFPRLNARPTGEQITLGRAQPA